MILEKAMNQLAKAHLPVVVAAVAVGIVAGVMAPSPPSGPVEPFGASPEVRPTYSFCDPGVCQRPSGVEVPAEMPVLLDRKYADSMGDVPFHASRAPLNKKPTPENGGHYHRVGEILLAHAYYVLGARKGHVSEEAKRELEKAHLYLYALRPVPQYAYWSKALYQDAFVLELLGNEQGKMANLNVIARVRSRAPAASLARVYLAGLLYRKGSCSRALEVLRGAVAIPEEYRDLAGAIRLGCAVRDGAFPKNVKELYRKAPARLRPWLVWEYASKVGPGGVDLEWLSTLPSKETRCALAMLYSKVDRRRNPELALRLCSMME